MSERLDEGVASIAHEIETTPVVTLELLAAEGKFVSTHSGLPQDCQSADWLFTLDGVEYPGLSLTEVYAPGDSSGYAVSYIKKDGEWTAETAVIRGNWAIERKPKQELSEAPIA